MLLNKSLAIEERSYNMRNWKSRGHVKGQSTECNIHLTSSSVPPVTVIVLTEYLSLKHSEILAINSFHRSACC